MKTACTLLLLCLSLAGLAQNYPYNGTDTSAVMEYNDDKQWVYYERDGFLVGMAASRMSGDFGTYFRVDLLVQNLTDSAIVFSSENVFAKIVTREGRGIKRDAFSFDEFKRRNGSLICAELLGLKKAEGSPQASERTPEYYAKRPCPRMVETAARIWVEHLRGELPADGE